MGYKEVKWDEWDLAIENGRFQGLKWWLEQEQWWYNRDGDIIYVHIHVFYCRCVRIWSYDMSVCMCPKQLTKRCGKHHSDNSGVVRKEAHASAHTHMCIYIYMYTHANVCKCMGLWIGIYTHTYCVYTCTYRMYSFFYFNHFTGSWRISVGVSAHSLAASSFLDYTRKSQTQHLSPCWLTVAQYHTDWSNRDYPIAIHDANPSLSTN